MNINSRFKEIINTCYNGNKRAFSIAVGLSTSVVENVVGKRNGNPSYEVLEKICANTNINPTWLLTGTGPMLRNTSDSNNAVKDVSNSNIQQGGISISGNNNSFNPNDIGYLHQVIAQKDEIITQKEQYIIKLRRDVEKQHDELVSKLEEKERYYLLLIKEKDDRNQEIIHNSYIRNEDNQKRIMDKDKLIAQKDEQITSLYNKIIELNEKLILSTR